METITNQILWKLNKCDTMKIMASGFAIMTAVRSTLQVITSGITREQVGISAITIESIEEKPQVVVFSLKEYPPCRFIHKKVNKQNIPLIIQKSYKK